MATIQSRILLKMINGSEAVGISVWGARFFTSFLFIVRPFHTEV